MNAAGQGEVARAREAAAARAVEAFVQDGMKVGLGSGRTAEAAVRALAARVRAGLRVVGVATSPATQALAAGLGIALGELDDLAPLDLCLDSADELDPAGRMIKGGGGHLLREKIVARAARRWVGAVDEGKRVAVLGRFPLPVEVVPFGWRTTAGAVREVLAARGHGAVQPRLRGGEAAPLVTASGHHLLDLPLGRIEDPAGLAAALTAVPGVVETGLFLGVASAVAVGHGDGTSELVTFVVGGQDLGHWTYPRS